MTFSMFFWQRILNVCLIYILCDSRFILMFSFWGPAIVVEKWLLTFLSIGHILVWRSLKISFPLHKFAFIFYTIPRRHLRQETFKTFKTFKTRHLRGLLLKQILFPPRVIRSPLSACACRCFNFTMHVPFCIKNSYFNYIPRCGLGIIL